MNIKYILEKIRIEGVLQDILAKSNGEMVEKAVKIAKLLGREIATPAEARQILGLTK